MADKTEFWLPAFPYRCIDYLSDRGTYSEGLYRVPGSELEIKHYMARFDRGMSPKALSTPSATPKAGEENRVLIQVRRRTRHRPLRLRRPPRRQRRSHHAQALALQPPARPPSKHAIRHHYPLQRIAPSRPRRHNPALHEGTTLQLTAMELLPPLRYHGTHLLPA